MAKYDRVTPVTARDLIALAGLSFALYEVKKWSTDQRKAAADWAYAVYLSEQGVVVNVPTIPDFLKSIMEEK